MFSQPDTGSSSNEQDSCVCACVCKWSYAVQTIFYSTLYINNTTGFQVYLAYLRHKSSMEKPQGRIYSATSLNYGGQKSTQRMIQISGSLRQKVASLNAFYYMVQIRTLQINSCFASSTCICFFVSIKFPSFRILSLFCDHAWILQRLNNPSRTGVSLCDSIGATVPLTFSLAIWKMDVKAHSWWRQGRWCL